MIILKLILLIIAIFTTLLWIMKLISDSIGTMYGGQTSDEDAQKDGVFRIYLITIMSVAWSLIIIMS